MIVVQHAYSRGNSGDGMLVDLTLARLRRLFGDVPTRVYAADAASFPDLSDVVQVPAASGRYRERLVGCADQAVRLAAAMLGIGHAAGATLAPVALAELVVGVGGGYLRASSPVQRLKFSLVNLPQLLAAAEVGRRAVYLPQSIGPFGTPLQGLVRAAVGRIGAVCVRDDRSRDFVAAANVHRIPDLAVLAVVERLGRRCATRRPERFVVCARELGFRGDERARYAGLLRTLLDRLPKAILAVQSRGRGNDDEQFYRRELGTTGQLPSMREALERHPDAAVVSVRLHGALQAVMCGVPAVHLSYERKGFGAFDDLGLGGFVWNARTCPAETVLAAAEMLHADPEVYWNRLADRTPASLRPRRGSRTDRVRIRCPRRRDCRTTTETARGYRASTRVDP